jgi:hypothetical protein
MTKQIDSSQRRQKKFYATVPHGGIRETPRRWVTRVLLFPKN